jgi:hypothetical protein
MFRPRGFAPPRRFAPRVSCGSVAPRNRRGFTAFRACLQGVARRRPSAGISSRGAFRTLRRVPLVSSRKRITATVAFLSLPSCPVWERRPKPVITPTAIPADAGGVRPRPAWGGATAPRRAGSRSQRTGRDGFRRTWGRVRGRGRAGLRRAPSPGPTRWVHRSEERWGLPRRSGPLVPRGDGLAPKSRGSEPGGAGEGGAPKSSVAGSRRGGSIGPKTGGPASMAVSTPRVGGSRREPGQDAGAPESHGEMPGITGVRARRLGTGCEEEIPMR